MDAKSWGCSTGRQGIMDTQSLRLIVLNSRPLPVFSLIPPFPPISLSLSQRQIDRPTEGALLDGCFLWHCAECPSPLCCHPGPPFLFVCWYCPNTFTTTVITIAIAGLGLSLTHSTDRLFCTHSLPCVWWSECLSVTGSCPPLVRLIASNVSAPTTLPFLSLSRSRFSLLSVLTLQHSPTSLRFSTCVLRPSL